MNNPESLQDILAQIEVLKEKAAVMQKAAVAGAIQDIKEKMRMFNISIDDLMDSSKKTRGTVAAKYRNPATGDEWTGRGKPPKWLVAEIESGKSREDFLI